MSRSNLVKICNTTNKLNFFFISVTRGVHMGHNDCLWCVVLIMSQKTRSIYVQSVNGLLRDLLFHFLTRSVHT